MTWKIEFDSDVEKDLMIQGRMVKHSQGIFLDYGDIVSVTIALFPRLKTMFSLS